jgi:RsiW-degrading membrane proteinase PrsW (M82 family)
MKILDYIFYRTYMAYVKANDPATFGSVSYLMICLTFLLLPIGGGLAQLIRGENDNIFNFFMILYFILIVTFVLVRYLRRNKIRDIIAYFLLCNANSIIPTWCIFLVVPICMVTGVAGFLLECKYIIVPYNLEGIWYDSLIKLFGN